MIEIRQRTLKESLFLGNENMQISFSSPSLSKEEIYLGRAGAEKGGIYGDFMMDRLEVWEAWKPLLSAFNFFNAG